MNEENEKQPAPLETESASPEQRHPRPRRRFPRRRYRGGDRFRPDNSEKSPNSSTTNADNTGADVAVETLDQPVREAAESVGETSEPVQTEPEFGEGIIEISGKGFGFLRDPKRNFVQTPQDIFVTPEIVRRFALRDGMWINGEIRRGSRGPQLTKLLTINAEEPTKYQGLRPFEELTTINPNKRIKLETVLDRYTTRIMDLMTPLGMGQRGLIVAPPRTGKTTLLHHIADAVAKNHPEVILIILLVDERPEEVTDFRRSHPTAELMPASTTPTSKVTPPFRSLLSNARSGAAEQGKMDFYPLTPT